MISPRSQYRVSFASVAKDFWRMAMARARAIPHHMVLFEPGEVWLVGGRTVPHQVTLWKKGLFLCFTLLLTDRYMQLIEHFDPKSKKLTHGVSSRALKTKRTDKPILNRKLLTDAPAFINL